MVERLKTSNRTLIAHIVDDNWQKISEFLDKDSETEAEADIEAGKSAARETLNIAEEQCSDIFVDQFGTPYAAVKIDEHKETLPLKSSRFKSWLCRTYYTSEDKILHAESMTNVLNILKAKAEFEGVTRTLNLRVTSVQEELFTIYYDLTNKDW